MNETSNLHQRIMDKAYERWQSSNAMTQTSFWNTLSPLEQAAIFLGNFNYQVCNGGFSQWWGNDYAKARVIQTIEACCDTMNTENAKKVRVLMRDYRAVFRRFTDKGLDATESEMRLSEGEYDEFERDLSALDSRYYLINEAFMAEVNEYLAKLLVESLQRNPLYNACARLSHIAGQIEAHPEQRSPLEQAIYDVRVELNRLEYLA